MVEVSEEFIKDIQEILEELKKDVEKQNQEYITKLHVKINSYLFSRGF